MLGIVWGAIATWWVGVLLGVPLATVARAGSRPKRSAVSLVRPMMVLMVCIAVFAVLAGIVGYLAASNGLVELVGRMAERVPADRQVAFLTDLWIHNASYLGGFVGGIVLMVRVWRSRGLGSQAVPAAEARDYGSESSSR